MTLARRSFLPMIVTRGSDQSQISSSFQTRNDPSNLRNFGSLLLDFAKIVPDGIVVFFPSYLYMESTLHVWSGMGILDMIWNYKLILVETPDAQESSLALETYRTACCNGRGAYVSPIQSQQIYSDANYCEQYFDVCRTVRIWMLST